MALGTWWMEFKLERVNRKLKRAHYEQRQLRDRLERLRADRAAGKLTEDAFAEKDAAIRTEKARITERVAALNAEEDALKRTLQRTGRAAS